MNTKSNSELVELILSNSDLKQQAWEQLLKQQPDNEDLRYIIEYTDLKQQAAEQLLKQQPSNYDLSYIIEYTDLKQQAWEQLLKQQPSNYDLRYIIRYTDLKQQAAQILRGKFGITGPVDELADMKEIAKNVLERPGSLKMDKWHCGTSHCIGGWECMLNKDAAEIEKRSDTETAAYAMLPSYSHLFYKSDGEALEFLNNLLNQ